MDQYVFNPKIYYTFVSLVIGKLCMIDLSRSIINIQQQTTFLASFFKPSMIRTIELAHFSIKIFSWPFHPISMMFLCSLFPNSILDHYPSNRFFRNINSELRPKIFCDKYWVTILIVFLFYDILYNSLI